MFLKWNYTGSAIIAFCILGNAMHGTANAEEAFMKQIPVLAATPKVLGLPKNAASMYTYQYGNRNIAVGIDTGLGNTINQVQIGNRNSSFVGLAANNTRVDVVQIGSGLSSKLAIVGTPVFNVGVLQTRNSPPVNASITTKPNGQTIIRPGANARVTITGLPVSR